jgi:hypothetical protein
MLKSLGCFNQTEHTQRSPSRYAGRSTVLWYTTTLFHRSKLSSLQSASTSAVNLRHPVEPSPHWLCAAGVVLPIQVANHNGQPVAMKVSSIDRPGLFEQFWRMGLSQNLEEWEAAMAMQQLPIFNTCYADRDGHIMYVYNANVPVHLTGSYEFWQGVVPVRKTPQPRYNDARGIVLSASHSTTRMVGLFAGRRLLTHLRRNCTVGSSSENAGPANWLVAKLQRQALDVSLITMLVKAARHRASGCLTVHC